MNVRRDWFDRIISLSRLMLLMSINTCGSKRCEVKWSEVVLT